MNWTVKSIQPSQHEIIHRSTDFSDGIVRETPVGPIDWVNRQRETGKRNIHVVVRMSDLEFHNVVKQGFSVFLTSCRSCEKGDKKIEKTHCLDATTSLRGMARGTRELLWLPRKKVASSTKKRVFKNFRTEFFL
jgi:hypothetical protein